MHLFDLQILVFCFSADFTKLPEVFGIGVV